jgi:hypothetical protein
LFPKLSCRFLQADVISTKAFTQQKSGGFISCIRLVVKPFYRVFARKERIRIVTAFLLKSVRKRCVFNGFRVFPSGQYPMKTGGNLSPVFEEH